MDRATPWSDRHEGTTWHQEVYGSQKYICRWQYSLVRVNDASMHIHNIIYANTLYGIATEWILLDCWNGLVHESTTRSISVVSERNWTCYSLISSLMSERKYMSFCWSSPAFPNSTHSSSVLVNPLEILILTFVGGVNKEGNSRWKQKQFGSMLVSK